MIKVCVISPAAGVLSIFPNRVENGKKWFISQEIELLFAPHSMENSGYVSAGVQKRIEDIEYAIDKSDVIIASIGGYNSSHLLKNINYELFNKDVSLCGYSDVTALLLAVYSKTKRIVYHAPTFLPELCEYPKPFDYTWHYFEQVVIRHELVKYQAPEYRIYEFADWNDQEKHMVKRDKHMQKVSWTIVKTGIGTGILIGGNVNTIIHIIGTEYCPIDNFNDSILFIEATNYNLAEFDSYITGLKLRGIFERVNGLAIGSFGKEGDIQSIVNMLIENLNEYNFPVIADVDLGHTDPMITIPIGAKGYLCANDDGTIEFSVLEY